MGSKYTSLKIHLVRFVPIIIVGLYLFLRLGFRETIEFGHDQPLLANQILEFIKKPSFIESYSFVLPNPWGFPSWGPAQIFFWVPFFLISKNPITVSLFVAIINLLGIYFVYLIGNKFFSQKVGLIASLILAVHPWSVIFSRMVYQPTPVLVLIPLLMFISLYLIDNPKSKLLFFLPLLWVFLFQVYVHTFIFIVFSFVALVLNFRKLSKLNFAIGIFLGLLLLIPVFHYFQENPNEISGIGKVSNKFVELKTESPYPLTEIVHEFLGVTGGGRFNWQLGYSYGDFKKIVPTAQTAENVGIFLVVFVLFYSVIKIIFEKDGRNKRILLLLWLVSPVIFLVLVRAPIALPRYYLISLPPFALLLGLLLGDFAKKYKTILVYLPIVGFFTFWVYFITIYYNFVLIYKYDQGFLSYYSDIPHIFLERGFAWIKIDADKSGFSRVIVEPVNQASGFYVNHYLKFLSQPNEKDSSVGRYKFTFSGSTRLEVPDAQFGPYVLTRIKN